MISTSIIRYLIIIEMEELPSRISSYLLSNILLGLRKSMSSVMKSIYQECEGEVAGGKEVGLEIR